METSKIDTGRLGEEKAAIFLKKSGYRIIERNFRSALGEIDIIAQEGRVICFVEVRTRRASLGHEDALTSVNRTKQHRLSKMAVSFLKEKKMLEHRARFDVISVLLFDTGEDIRLLKDAFPVSERYA